MTSVWRDERERQPLAQGTVHGSDGRPTVPEPDRHAGRATRLLGPLPRLRAGRQDRRGVVRQGLQSLPPQEQRDRCLQVHIQGKHRPTTAITGHFWVSVKTTICFFIYLYDILKAPIFMRNKFLMLCLF